MSRFYGVVQGNRGDAHRTGSTESGIDATAASWAGAVTAKVYVGEGDEDWVDVRFCKWSGCGSDLSLYEGPVQPDAQHILESILFLSGKYLEMCGADRHKEEDVKRIVRVVKGIKMRLKHAALIEAL